MTDKDGVDNDVRSMIVSMRRRLAKLTVAVLLLTLAVMLCTAANFGQLMNYFGGDYLILGLVAVLSALSGFGLGWLAGRSVFRR